MNCLGQGGLPENWGVINLLTRSTKHTQGHIVGVIVPISAQSGSFENAFEGIRFGCDCER